VIKTEEKIIKRTITIEAIQLEATIEGPFSMQTLIELQTKSGEIVREAINAVKIIEEALYTGNAEALREAAGNFSKVCKEGIETIKSSFPEVLINWSLRLLIKSLEESILSGEALMKGDEQGFAQHFQKSTELMDRHNMFLEQLKAKF